MAFGFTLSLAKVIHHGRIYHCLTGLRTFIIWAHIPIFPGTFLQCFMLVALLNSLQFQEYLLLITPQVFNMLFPLPKCNLLYFLLPPWQSSINHHTYLLHPPFLTHSL